MEGLRWWLLLLTALMFSMSGCASHERTIRATNRAHFASAQHLTFSVTPTVLGLERARQ